MFQIEEIATLLTFALKFALVVMHGIPHMRRDVIQLSPIHSPFSCLDTGFWYCFLTPDTRSILQLLIVTNQNCDGIRYIIRSFGDSEYLYRKKFKFSKSNLKLPKFSTACFALKKIWHHLIDNYAQRLVGYLTDPPLIKPLIYFILIYFLENHPVERRASCINNVGI